MTVLSGYDYGKSIIKDQLSYELGALRNDSILIIDVPKRIKSVSSSFANGFTEAIIDSIKSEGLVLNIFIRGNGRVVERLLSSYKERTDYERYFKFS